MPKVTKIERAGKDYPEFGIKKGESHYVWSIKMQRGGIVRRSKTYPRQSQLTMSEYKGDAYRINEQIEDLKASDYSDVSDVESARDDLVSNAEELRDSQQDKLDNMPEGLQQGSTGEMLQSRIDAMDQFISELESIDFDEFDEDQEHAEWSEDNRVNSEGQTIEEVIEALVDQIKEISIDVE